MDHVVNLNIHRDIFFKSREVTKCYFFSRGLNSNLTMQSYVDVIYSDEDIRNCFVWVINKYIELRKSPLLLPFTSRYICLANNIWRTYVSPGKIKTQKNMIFFFFFLRFTQYTTLQPLEEEGYKVRETVFMWVNI